MTHPRIDLAPGTTALVVPGASATAQPELWLNSPAVVLRTAPTGPTGDAGDGTPPPDADRTVGSRAWLWADDEDWRFDAESGALTSVTLTLPEVNTQTDPELHAWNQSPALPATLRLEEPQDFTRPPTTARWINPAGTHLIGWYTPQPPPEPRHRITLAPQTNLLIAANTLVGWTIEDPARYITGEAVPPSTRGTNPDPRLPPLLATFFALVTEENVDKLEEGDTRLRTDLHHLATSLETIGADGEPRAVEILTKVRQVLEDFGG